ncbi:hypothetical protein PM082_001803 [Marasmius tenuissimus]|nr:hypothetical protein PM082_001803 [Marasmius tenuissimus]
MSTRTATTVTTGIENSSHPGPCRDTPNTSPPSTAQDDSDNPNDDATISFARDSDVDHTPTVVTAASHTTSRSNPPLLSQLSPSLASESSVSSSSPVPLTQASRLQARSRSGNNQSPSTYYEFRYGPGKIPHPNTMKAEPKSRPEDYYVVTRGIQVGIFTDW